MDQTIKFALRNKTPAQREEGTTREEYVERVRDEILGSLGILHTKKTLVGNEFVRGVSGGERKRVSLAEVMAGQVSTHTRELASVESRRLTIISESRTMLGSINPWS